jgi:hypothetical protein
MRPQPAIERSALTLFLAFVPFRLPASHVSIVWPGVRLAQSGAVVQRQKAPQLHGS